jgi:hypothetical protein
VARGRPLSLWELAARAGFWTLDKVTLTWLAEYLGVAVERGSSVFDIVFALVQHVLPLMPEVEQLALCSARLSSLARQANWVEEIAHIDECAEVLGVHDRQVVEDEKATQKSATEAARQFREQFSQRMRAARQSAGGRKAGKPKRGAAATRPTRARLPKWHEQGIPLELARSMKPEGSSLWMQPRFGNWQGHFPPLPRISRSWDKYGEAGALELVLQYLWTCWSDVTGGDLSQAPEGLFRESQGAAGAAGSAD